MTIFEEPDTQCTREDNKCKQRNKCLRYIQHKDGVWTADYWGEFGQFCCYFKEIPKPELRI